MRFRDILGDERLWAVVYDGEKEDILSQTFSRWMDLDALFDFFEKNAADLASYFRITDISQAVFETVEDAVSLKARLREVGPDTYLITGGAIKLTRTMEEREHTRKELIRMEQVRDFLLEQGVADLDGFKDTLS